MSQAAPQAERMQMAGVWLSDSQSRRSEISFGSLYVSIGCLTDLSRLHACCARASLATEERGFLAYELSLAHEGILHRMGQALISTEAISVRELARSSR